MVYIPMGTFQVIGGKKHKSRSSEVSWVLCVSLKGDVPAGCGARPCSVPGLGGSRGSWAARSPPSTAHVVVLVSRLCSFLHQPAASNWVNYILPTFFLLFRNKQTPKQKKELKAVRAACVEHKPTVKGPCFTAWLLVEAWINIQREPFPLLIH